MNLRLIIPGNPAIKKNGMKHKWWEYRNGKKVPLSVPITYYNDNYVEWAKNAIVHLVKLRHNHLLPEKPLEGEYIVSFHFYRKDKPAKIDLSNLYEAPQDLLSGNAGISMKVGVKRYMFQIFSDDNSNIIVNHGASRCFFNDPNPRTVIYISEFTWAKWAQLFAICHPDMKEHFESKQPVIYIKD